MPAIIFSILKITGIILLVLLVLILLIILLILFVPIRYKGRAGYDKAAKGFINISWLLSFIRFRADYDRKLSYTFKILFLKLADSENEAYEKQGDISHDSSQIGSISAKDNDGSVESRLNTEERVEEKKRNTRKRRKGKSKKKRKGGAKEPFIKRLISRVRAGFAAAAARIKKLKGNIDRVRDFISAEENKRGFKIAWKYLIKFLKHILPVKLKGRVKFGFSDPYTTGQVLSYAALFYGAYHKELLLIPVWDEEIIEGELDFHGRITLARVLYIVLIVWFNKDFKQLYRKLRGGSNGGK